MGSHGVGDLEEAVVGSISNATATVITAGTSGISKVLSAIGGPSGIILYILVIALYVYVIYSRVRQGSTLTVNVGSKNSHRSVNRKQHILITDRTDRLLQTDSQ